jgi:hypothetical protein
MTSKRLGLLLLLIAVAVSFWTGQTACAQERQVTLDLREARLDDALRLLFEGMGYDYTLEPGLEELKVTVLIRDTAFPQALRAVLDLHKLTYRKDQTSYYITRKVESETRASAPAPAAERPAAEEQYFWIGPDGRYELQALDARQVASWFNGTAIFMSPIPVAVAVPSLGGIGGVGGGIGGGANIVGGTGSYGNLGTFGSFGTPSGLTTSPTSSFGNITGGPTTTSPTGSTGRSGPGSTTGRPSAGP